MSLINLCISGTISKEFIKKNYNVLTIEAFIFILIKRNFKRIDEDILFEKIYTNKGLFLNKTH